MSAFHETGDHAWKGAALYREVALVDDAGLFALLKDHRPYYLAFAQAKFDLDAESLELLQWLCSVVSCSSGQYHYARLILMTERPEQSFKTFLAYLEKAFPLLLDDRRVFVSVLRRTGDDQHDLQSALGAADPVGRDKHGKWAVLPLGMV